MPRIVSLLPSATEIVCALGFQDQLVGRSHECDFPPGVARLPALTTPRFDPEGASGEVNDRVRRILAEALAVYRVDAARLRELRPDFIVTQAQCDVCAVSLGDVEDAVAQWTGARPRIVSLAPWGLADVFADMERVGAALDAPARGAELAGGLKRRIDAIRGRAATAAKRPRVACLEWLDPLMDAGNWMPELVEAAGAVSLLGKAGEHSSWIEFAAIAAADPEVILIAPCGFTMERTAAELPALWRRAGWSELRAVRDGRVFLAEGNQYFNRPGPRIVESLEILAELLHPEVFRFGHEGSGWRRVTDALHASA